MLNQLHLNSGMPLPKQGLIKMVVIMIKGLERVQRLISKLPKEINLEINKKSSEFMAFVQKSAKLRAPRNTGFLADQIRVFKKGKTIVLNTGEAYYAHYQEFGFTPHVIPTEFIEQHAALSPNIPGQFVFNPKGFARVARHKPFIFPALESGLSNLPNMLSIGTKNAIEKARR